MDNQLRQLQLTQLEILKYIDGICRSHNIPYSLYAGTLLGAVRHQGFIPWDDDLDICMSRENYNRFLALWDCIDHSGYILQNKENTPAFNQSFTKIRKDHTTFLQYDFERNAYHTGIFVDIFPIDRAPAGKLQNRLFQLDCMRYQLYTREFIPPKAGAATKLVSGLLLWAVPKKRRPKVRARLLEKITRNNCNNGLPTVAIECMASLRVRYSADMLDQYTALPFEDGQFMCFAQWHDHLHRKFGDYMQPPPESDRLWRHHPIILDFEHNYEELPR